MFLVLQKLTQQELEKALFLLSLMIQLENYLEAKERNLELSQVEKEDVDGSMVF